MENKIHDNSLQLYRFIRLVLGEEISDNQIARLWHMDVKNFNDFKKGRLPVPRIERLEALAEVLGVPKSLVFEVAGGGDAEKALALARSNDFRMLSEVLSESLARSLRELRAAEERFRAIMDDFPEMIQQISLSRRLEFVNKRALCRLKYSHDSILSKNLEDLCPPEEAGRVVHHTDQVIREGEHVLKTSMLTAQGEPIPVLLHSTLLRDGSGLPSGILGYWKEVDAEAGREVLQCFACVTPHGS
ncbi:MAG: PAS domain S-box protein [Candidatus Tectomicrobia bacterium]|uniref:PAS domain S-box protein n=1 Tax=Tectimicrobiota bacterium TaxID=2528274 RepID=A0A932GNV4_UNCTE|nr:PAS domain S-box protein [Candidatus Tectomicrobia bacterium]